MKVLVFYMFSWKHFLLFFLFTSFLSLFETEEESFNGIGSDVPFPGMPWKILQMLGSGAKWVGFTCRLKRLSLSGGAMYVT